MTTALRKIVNAYERLVLSFGGADVDNLKYLIASAREELAGRNVDVVRLLEDAELSCMDETIEDMTRALHAQGISTATTRKDAP